MTCESRHLWRIFRAYNNDSRYTHTVRAQKQTSLAKKRKRFWILTCKVNIEISRIWQRQRLFLLKTWESCNFRTQQQLHYTNRAGLRHWGPHAKCHGGPPFSSPPLPSPALSSALPSLPFPSLPSPLLPYLVPSFYLFSFRSGHLNTAMGPGSAVSSLSGVWGEAPADKRFGAYLSQKGLLWWQQFFYGVSRKNICNFHYFLHKNN